MTRVKVYCNFEEGLDPVIMVDSDKQVEVIIDYLIPDELPRPIPPNTIRFVVNIQPEGHFNHLIRQYQNNYDHLLTFIPELLTLPKAKFFIGLTNFCRASNFTYKTFGVSSIFSGRNCLPGHRIRHELWSRQDEIYVPKWFYSSSRAPGPQSDLVLPQEKNGKEIAMNTMFHIAIDSYDYPNSFSEKLIDPLISGCVVIYWGASNVNDFFENIIAFRSVDELIDICNNLSEADYWDNLNYTNIRTAMNYTNYGAQLQRKLQEVLNENT